MILIMKPMDKIKTIKNNGERNRSLANSDVHRYESETPSPFLLKGGINGIIKGRKATNAGRNSST